jgi:hypothetical protein
MNFFMKNKIFPKNKKFSINHSYLKKINFFENEN